jgi:hypothetical protein
VPEKFALAPVVLSRNADQAFDAPLVLQSRSNFAVDDFQIWECAEPAPWAGPSAGQFLKQWLVQIAFSELSARGSINGTGSELD